MEAELNHLTIFFFFLQATNYTKNLVIFVDFTDDWRVFIGGGEVSQQEAWAIILLTLFSYLSPFSF